MTGRRLAGDAGSSRAAAAYARLVALAERAYRAAAAERCGPAERDALRWCLAGLSEALDDRAFALTISAWTAAGQDAGTPLAVHVSNVAIHTLRAAKLLGVDRATLLALGFAAVFHDVGRAPVGRYPDLGPAIIETPEDHVTEGLRLACLAGSTDPDELARLVVIAEHHCLTDGYPVLGLGDPHPFARLISVAEAFDGLENGTPWRAPLGPAASMERLLTRPKRYDPVAAGLLRSSLGERPRGSLLELDGEALVVLEGGADHGQRPLVAPATLAADGEDGVRRLDPDERDRAKLLPADAASWALMLHQVLVPAASAGPGPNRGDV